MIAFRVSLTVLNSRSRRNNQPHARMSHSRLHCDRLGLQAPAPQLTYPSLLFGRHLAPLRRNAGLPQDHANRVVADAVSLGKLSKARTSGDVRSDDSLPVGVIDPANESASRGPGRERNRFTVS